MAHDYRATVLWTRNGAVFTDNRYSRGHLLKFDGIEVPGSSAPSSVRLPYSVAEAVDPEEALGAAAFTDNRYSRGHVWKFDGIEVPGSSAPSSVRLPYSVAEAVDPEEALVAAVSSCHMLFFLTFAATEGFTVERYEDAALGVMTKNESGKLFVSKVTLSPAVTFTGAKRPTVTDVDALHHHAHEECYIANSVKAEVVVVPTFTLA